MNEDKIRQIIRSEIASNDSRSRFSLNSIPRHVHNGTDSPLVFQPTLTYYGHVDSGGTAIILPKGWTSVANGTIGSYDVTHNLNTAVYTVVASAVQSTNNFAMPVIEAFENSFTISWGGGLLGAATIDRATTAFFFSLTVVANSSQTFPQYLIA